MSSGFIRIAPCLGLLLVACAGETQPLDAGPEPDAGPTSDGGSEATDARPKTCAETMTPPSDGPYVTLERGYVRGLEVSGVTAFLGIPFAEPPTGELRWRAPAAPSACFATPFEATDFGPKCPQLEASEFVGDEDCLQLNVWTPSLSGGPKPVMFFIHGGGNAIGSTRETAGEVPIYDGAALAQQGDVVVVTANYRLGQLGWLAHPVLDDAQGRSGNYGLLDLVLALRWVQENIAALGGDPSRVLIFGESAGAVNTCLLLASPLTEGLFQAALMQSGGCPGYTRAQVEAESEPFVEDSGCAAAPDPAACLRALDAETLIRTRTPIIEVAGFSSRMQPHVDGNVLPEPPLYALTDGPNRDVVLVVGANSEETSRSAPALQTEAQYEAAVRALVPLPALADQVLAQYPAADFPTPRAAFVRLTTDAKFVCPSRSVLRARVAGGRVAHRYVFTHALDSGPGRVFGAWHGLELAFVFDKLEIGGYVPSEAERSLARTMQAYWSSLAWHGSPSAPGAPAWPVYDRASDPYLVLDGDRVEVAHGFRTEACDFWDGLAPGG